MTKYILQISTNHRLRMSIKKRASLLILMGMALLLASCAPDEGPQLVADGNDAFYAEEYDSANQLYAQAIGEGANTAETYYNAANTQYKQDNFQGSLSTLTQILPQTDGDLTANSFFNLGNTYYNSESYELAAEAFKEALRRDPNDVDAKINLELALQRIAENQPTPEPTPSPDDTGEEGTDDEDEGGGEEEETPEAPTDGGDEQDGNPTPPPPPEPEEGESEEESDGNPEDQEDPEGEQDPESEAEQDAGSQEGDSGDGSDAAPEELDSADSGNDQDIPVADGLTVEQATQLLDGVGQGTETLQERLQQIYGIPGAAPPEKDW